MKRFFVDGVVVTAVFIVAWLLLEFFVFPHLSNNIFNYKYNYVKNNSNNISILLMGNSYFENSFNPHLLGDSTFDMAASARWIYYDKELMEKFVPEMDNLKAVIFPMGYKYPFMGSHHFVDSISLRCVDYLHEKYMNVWYDRFPENFIRSLYVVDGLVSGTKLFDNNMYCDPMGYSAYIGHQNDNWKNEHNIDSEEVFSKEPEKQVEEYFGYLRDMVAVCNQHGVRFIVVTPPCHDSFLANVKQEKVKLLHDLMEGIGSEYAIEYVDYLQDGEFREDSLYFNCSHLNSDGADKFALRVKKDFGL